MSAQLRVPDPAFRRSFTAALREFHAENRNLDIDPDALDDTDAFAAFVAGLHAQALSDTPRPQAGCRAPRSGTSTVTSSSARCRSGTG